MAARRGGPLGAPSQPARTRRTIAALALVLTVALVVPLGGSAAGAVLHVVTQAQTPVPAGQRLPDPAPSTEASKQEAAAILSGPEYQEPPKSFWESIAEWFQKALGKVLGNTGSVWGGFTYIILAALIGAVLFILVRLRGTSRLSRPDAGFEFDLEDRRPPAEWVADAERFESRGEWKQALRCRFRALVGELIGLGALRDLPGRTTGEYRVELRRFAPAVADAFSAGTDLFERAWYGDEDTGPQENARFRELAEQTVAGARAAARQADDETGVPA